MENEESFPGVVESVRGESAIIKFDNPYKVPFRERVYKVARISLPLSKIKTYLNGQLLEAGVTKLELSREDAKTGIVQNIKLQQRKYEENRTKGESAILDLINEWINEDKRNEEGMP